MKKIEEKLLKLRKEYEELLKEGDEKYYLLLKENSKNNYNEYKKIKKKEPRKLRQILKVYVEYFKLSEVKYEDWIQDEILRLKTGKENAQIYIIITLLQHIESKIDLSEKICNLSNLILDKEVYDEIDDYCLENLIDLLYLWKNPVQIPILKKIILKENYIEFRLLGKSISYLKCFKTSEVKEMISSFKMTTRYRSNEVFRNNIDDDVDPEFWSIV